MIPYLSPMLSPEQMWLVHPAAGMMLDCIQEVFDVTGLQLFALDRPAAAEFLEVYKGVVAPGEFSAMVDELVAGPCIAVEVKKQPVSSAMSVPCRSALGGSC
jgi:nucleoside-diphosphate kinase